MRPALSPLLSDYANLSRKTARLRPSSSCSCHLPMAACAASRLVNLMVPKPCGGTRESRR